MFFISEVLYEKTGTLCCIESIHFDRWKYKIEALKGGETDTCKKLEEIWEFSHCWQHGEKRSLRISL